METCPICGLEVEHIGGDFDRLMALLHCPACGTYAISDTATVALRGDEYDAERHLLSGVVRGSSDEENIPEITSDRIPALISAARPPSDPVEAIDQILMHVLASIEGANEHVELHDTDYPLVFARGPDEFSYLCERAVEQGYLEHVGGQRVRLTLDGWRRVRQLKQTAVAPDHAFVAMWFTEELESAWYEGFLPALEATGYEPIRIDLVEHNDRIDDRILAEIRRSGLLVADFTGNRAGVYFEAGFALGLDIPVVWTCRDGELEDLHFDTRQFNHIVWETPGDLAEKLEARIRATIPGRATRLND